MKIVFMGTPEFAESSLAALLSSRHQVVGVFPQPDKPKGRGYKLVPPPVKELAMAHSIPVYQPQKMRDGEALSILQELQPDLIAVVAYGKILPKEILELPKYGCVNVHGSLLPQYRGAAPIQWAVLNGEKETGVTAMYLTRKMDAGDMIDTAVTPIDPEETAGELLDRLAVLGAELLSKTLGRFARGEVEGTKQDEALVTYAPMLDKSMSPISWEKTAQQVHDQVRGLNPWPIATMELEGKRFKVYKTVIVPGKSGAKPGTVLGLTKTGLQIACSEGAVEIQILQAEGGKRMGAPDYFRGHPLGG